MTGNDYRRFEREQAFERTRPVADERLVTGQRNGRHDEVARGHHSLLRQVDDQVVVRVPAPEAADLDGPVAAMQHHSVVDGERRQRRSHLGRLGDVSVDESGCRKVAGVFVGRHRRAEEARLFLDGRSKTRRILRSSRQVQLARLVAFRGKRRTRLRTRHDLYSGKCVAIDLVTDDVVLVPVCVDDVRYRLVGQLAQRREAISGGPGSEVGIDDDDILGVDDEHAVRIDEDPGRFPPNRGKDSVGDLLDVKAGRNRVASRRVAAGSSRCRYR